MYPPTTEGRTVADGDELERRVAEQRRAFKEKHGHSAKLVPHVWIGQVVELHLVSGGGAENLLGVTKKSGILEAVLRYGYVLLVEDRVVFVPSEAVVQMELYDPNRRVNSQ